MLVVVDYQNMVHWISHSELGSNVHLFTWAYIYKQQWDMMETVIANTYSIFALSCF